MMKKNRLIAMLLALFVSQGYANAVIPFQRVFDKIATSKIFDATWDTLLAQLQPYCVASTRTEVEQYKYGNIDCREAVDAYSFTASSYGKGRIGMLKATFHGIGKCADIKKTLIRNFGNPTITKSACNLEWRLGHSKGNPQRYVGIEASEDENKIYFSIGEEQGP